MLACTCEGTVTGFGLASPKLSGERGQARQMLEGKPANCPAPGTAVVTDKGLLAATLSAHGPAAFGVYVVDEMLRTVTGVSAPGGRDAGRGAGGRDCRVAGGSGRSM